MIGDKHIKQARYYNANEVGISIVASITEGIDWAAYIGGDDGFSEAHCIEWTAQKGVKLQESDARHYFPDMALRYRN